MIEKSKKEPCEGCRRSGLPDNLKPHLSPEQDKQIFEAVKIIEMPGFLNHTYVGLRDSIRDICFPNFYSTEIGQHPPFSNLFSYYAEKWNNIFRVHHPNEYKIAIGLLWFYEEWVIDRVAFHPGTAHLSLVKWKTRKMDMWEKIFEWWAMSVDDIRTIVVNRIASVLTSVPLSE